MGVKREQNDETNGIRLLMNIPLYYTDMYYYSRPIRGHLRFCAAKLTGEIGNIMSKGAGIMVSDFIDEYSGFLAFTDEEYERAKAINPSAKSMQEFSLSTKRIKKTIGHVIGSWNR